MSPSLCWPGNMGGARGCCPLYRDRPGGPGSSGVLHGQSQPWAFCVFLWLMSAGWATQLLSHAFSWERFGGGHPFPIRVSRPEKRGTYAGMWGDFTVQARSPLAERISTTLRGPVAHRPFCPVSAGPSPLVRARGETQAQQGVRAGGALPSGGPGTGSQHRSVCVHACTTSPLDPRGKACTGRPECAP